MRHLSCESTYDCTFVMNLDVKDDLNEEMRPLEDK